MVDLLNSHDPQITNIGPRRAGYEQSTSFFEKMIGIVAR
jgi:hypothetical protein